MNIDITLILQNAVYMTGKTFIEFTKQKVRYFILKFHPTSRLVRNYMHTERRFQQCPAKIFLH